ncbi:SRPBCC family protein [Roseateles violae]|uniref:SRPBCC family protein n=1 Tax=Roseateles violae TaxID=3058042 RepID=A0ABT8DL86_9BURK|nr:SRPBCC family protein [Pelomonas sp. PFR6]MDN3919175.1 SRPBCC family protein [Pelomonas sp. PFR6]
MLKKILIVLLVAVLGLLGVAATRPDSFRVERSARIEAAPDKVFGLIQDLKQFNRWNPWLRKDPSTEGRYGNNSEGPGARYSWVSKEVGSGSMEITEVTAPSRMVMRLEFLEPMQTQSQAEFTLRPLAGGSTEVRWAMQGPAPYISKLMGLLFDMDKLIGKDFEDGLAKLKALAEQR